MIEIVPDHVFSDRLRLYRVDKFRYQAVGARVTLSPYLAPTARGNFSHIQCDFSRRE
jgi:hypothetical protein